MKDRVLPRGAGWRCGLRLAALAVIAGGGVVGGCLDRPLEPTEPGTTSVNVEPLAQSAVDKIDLLLMLDNSRSMADKQLILAAAVPDLVGALVNPRCLDAAGNPAQTQPSGPTEPCTPGARREFPPVLNIHLGIVTSSLGGHGSDSCSPIETASCNGQPNPSNDDAGHLVTRSGACGGPAVPTYQNKGFLAWDPGQKLTPPGTKDIGAISDPLSGMVSTVTPGIVPALKDLVLGVGQIGCGYQAQLESWYRFLVDPEPYRSISVQGGSAVPTGTDDVLLQQRRDCWPSSLLAVLMLTDENDCSIKEYGQFYYAAQQRVPGDPKHSFHLPRARQECATNPNDKCCVSCGQQAPAGCPVDPQCAASPSLGDEEDDGNLRCWDQKRRFGIDFLYPIDRYTQAITSLEIPNRQGDLVRNPLFTDLDPSDADSSVRDPSLVFLAGIVGVPWQDLARRDAAGKPDLLGGLDKDGKPVGGFKDAEELSAKDPSGQSGWDQILGDPGNYVPARDPHMIESIAPRLGLPGPGAAFDADPIEGHEHAATSSDLQYACTFGLPAPRDCSSGDASCDCPNDQNPLCDPNTPTTQRRAKSYPGLRELAALRSVGGQGIVGSVCAKQLTDTKAADYGYRPAIGALIARLKTAIGGQCLPRTLNPDKNGLVQCLVLEARHTDPGMCSCDPKSARQAVQESHKQAIPMVEAYPIFKAEKWNCYCEIVQTGDAQLSSPEELAACQGNPSDAPVIQGGKDAGKAANGWCYVDPAQNPRSSAELVKSCAPTEQHFVRFVGDGNPSNGSTLFTVCSGD